MTELLITSSILIIIVAVLRFTLKNKLSRRIRYALWGLVVLRLLLPFSLFTSPISAVDKKTVASVNNAAQSVRVPVRPYEYYTLQEYLEEYGSVLEKPLEQVNGLDLEAASVKRQTVPLETLLKWIWTGGAAAAAVWFFIQNTIFYIKLLKVRVPVETDENYKLKAYRADFLHSPCLFGLLRPAVYLNEKALADENTQRSVLTHELCHYAHGDNLWSFVRCVLLAVYWFDPFVWMAAAMSRTDCELACDEAAVNKLGEENRISYGKALVGMIEIKQAPVGLTCAATTMVSGKKGIKERVKMIADNHKTRAWAAIALALVIMFTVGCTFGIAKQKEPVTASEMTVAGLHLGMSTDEVTQLLGEPLTAQEKKVREDSPYTYRIWEYDGLKLLFTYSEAEGRHLLSSATISDESYRLPSGLKVGVNYEKVLKTYAKGEDYGESNSDYSADLLMFGADKDISSLFRLITNDPADITLIYRNMADGDQTGSGTAYFSKTYAGGMINYCWYPSDSDAFLVLSFIFDESGKVTKISFGDAEKNPVSWSWQSGHVVTPDDMAFGELKLGLTMDEVRTILGEPTKILDSDELEENTFIYGHYYTWYYGEELQLTFYRFDGILTAPYQLGSIWSESKAYQLLSGLTVGDKLINVIEAYAQDNHFGEKVIGNDGEPFGYYLYGGVTTEDFNGLPLTEAVGTAHVDHDTGTGTGSIIYHWYPVGSYGFEKSYSLIFDLDSFKNVTRIRFYYHSLMDPPQEAQ
ncbi:MAG TPA: M56 family metallopeptidase [Oscillospiraceae bacterium]|nr:M56 family metallopeptidase [Oscillospiraceae bacterium]HPS33898.1 M56 family metallopeptidase [Oscillospiraceae bacterium]